MKKALIVIALLILATMPSVVRAEELDPCFDGNCSYNVNATTGVTTITRLSDEEIALRQSYVPIEVPTPSPEPSIEPKYDLVVETPTQTFGTNGTIEQLTEVVTQLEEKAKSADEKKYDEPCLYTDCVKYVADGTKGTVEVVDITYRELRDRYETRIVQANRAQELANKAKEVLSQIVNKAKEIFNQLEAITEDTLPLIQSGE